MDKQLREIADKIITDEINRDIGKNGDITSNAIIQDNVKVKFSFIAKEDLILCGCDIIAIALQKDIYKNINLHYEDGDFLQAGSIIAEGSADAKILLLIERSVLNLVQHLSGIATLTNLYKKKLNNPAIKIFDTRKTTPGLRHLEKYAVRTGGGKNHRFGLFDQILIKDNHIAVNGSVKNTIQMAKNNNPDNLKIEIECDNLSQVKEAAECGVDIIMLDNMQVSQVKDAIEIIKNKAIIEVSGGINLDNIANYGKISGINRISIGSLTQSAKAANISLEIL